METSGEFLAVRPPLGQRVAVKSCVFVAGVVLMLARTSPALAADTHHGTNKGGGTSNAAVVQRTDTAPSKSDQTVGGGDGKGDGKDKGKGSSSAGASTVSAKSSNKESGENNSDGHGDTAGGKTGNGDDKAKSKDVTHSTGASTGNTTGTTGTAHADEGS